MTEYYEFEVELVGVEPRIWRSFLLKKSLSFQALHEAIQDSCNWGNCHLFEFTTSLGHDSDSIATSSDGMDEMQAGYYPPEAGRKKLKSYFEENAECIYIYDFGDGWIHRVKKISEREINSTMKRILLNGSRAFPLEDSGGLPGYDECVRAFRQIDLEKEEVQDRVEWIGDWNPDFFGIKEVQNRFDE